MKFTIATVILAAVTGVAAKSCVAGGVYCGTSLMNRGSYRDDIEAALRARGSPSDDTYVHNSRWRCLEHGDIEYMGYCEHGCGGVGNNDPDYCL